jgi:hypothetical protein
MAIKSRNICDEKKHLKIIDNSKNYYTFAAEENI